MTVTKLSFSAVAVLAGLVAAIMLSVAAASSADISECARDMPDQVVTEVELQQAVDSIQGSFMMNSVMMGETVEIKSAEDTPSAAAPVEAAPREILATEAAPADTPSTLAPAEAEEFPTRGRAASRALIKAPYHTCIIKRYPGVKTYVSAYQQDHPKVMVAPYSQPPSITFYDEQGNIIDQVMIEEEHSVTEIRAMLIARGL